MEKNDIYCGSGKEVTFKNGGSVINLNIEVDNIPEEFIRISGGRRYVNLVAGRRKSGPGKNGETHWLKVSQYSPDGKKKDYGRGTDSTVVKNENAPASEDDLPF